MTILLVARLGLGLLGVLAAVLGLATFPNAVLAANILGAEHGTAYATLGVLLPFALLWAMSYYLVFRNLTLAKYLSVPAEGEPERDASLLPRVLVGLGGLLVVAWALPSLVTAIYLWSTGQGGGQEGLRYMLPPVAQTVLGLMMAAGPDAVVRWWKADVRASAVE